MSSKWQYGPSIGSTAVNTAIYRYSVLVLYNIGTSRYEKYRSNYINNNLAYLVFYQVMSPITIVIETSEYRLAKATPTPSPYWWIIR